MSESTTEEQELPSTAKPDMPSTSDAEAEEHRYLSTGFTDWDSITGGLRVGQLTVLASTTGMGKTSLGLCVAWQAAVQKKTVGFVSLEMSKDDLVQKMISAHSKLNLDAPDLSDSDWYKVSQITNELYQSPLFIGDYSSILIEEIRTIVWSLKREYDISLLVLDSFQLLKHAEHHPNRLDELNAIARSCKALAKECKVAVLLISQLPQMVSKRENSRPLLTDLSLWGDVETIADVVVLMYSADRHKAMQQLSWELPTCTCKNCRSKGDVVEIAIAKNRSGPVGKFRLFFQPSYSLFSNIEHPT